MSKDANPSIFLSKYDIIIEVNMAQDKKKNWIQGAIKRPGAFTAKAKKKGMTPAGLAAKVTKNPSKYSKLTVQQANLAKTLRKINTKKKK